MKSACGNQGPIITNVQIISTLIFLHDRTSNLDIEKHICNGIFFDAIDSLLVNS